MTIVCLHYNFYFYLIIIYLKLIESIFENKLVKLKKKYTTIQKFGVGKIHFNEINAFI